MHDISERIAGLIKKHLNDGLGVEEKQELNQWVEKSGDNRQLFDRLNDEKYVLTELYINDEYEELVLSKVKQLIAADTKPGKIVSSWRRIMSVAAVILLLACGTYLILTHYAKRNNIAKTDQSKVKLPNDAAPGQYKAKLTLSDGSTIVLDSAGLGKLAQQGTVEVLNKDGKLVYSPSPGAKQDRGTVIAYNTLSTGRGETFATQLSEGTRIWLNSGSSVRYPVFFTGNDRRIEIKGEAYLEVAHNPAKPFHVAVGGMEVEILGTIFNIKAYDEEESIKTTLLEGRVKVIKKDHISVLKPGQQAQVNGEEIKVIDNASIEQVVAWKNGLFMFDNSDLKTVMRELARWYDMEVVYQGSAPNPKFVGEISMQSNLSEVLALLKQNGVITRIEGRKIIVLP